MLHDAHKSLNKSARVSMLELRKVRFRQGKNDEYKAEFQPTTTENG